MRVHGRALIALSVAACAGQPERARDSSDAVAGPRLGHVDAGPALFQGAVARSFQVDRDGDRELLVVDGCRYVASANGKVLEAAVDEEVLLRGGLSVREDLGGGYVFWSNEALYHASTFSGPLARFEGVDPGVEVLGVRNGLGEVVAFLATGHVALDLAKRRVTAAREPGVADIAALDARRAVILDLLGRGWVTTDGGQTRAPLQLPERDSIRAIGLSTESILVDAWHDHYELRDLAKPAERASPAYMQRDDPFEIQRRGAWADESRHRAYMMSDISLVQSAVLGGVRLGDGTALAVIPRLNAEVDLVTGAPRNMRSDPLHEGLLCQPVAAPDALLFACRWQQYQYYGAYVFRAEPGTSPVLERAFSDDGGFVGTFDGALAFVGACSYRARLVDDGSHLPQRAAPVMPATICVRGAGGGWVERTLPEALGATLERWIPRVDGSAVAIVRSLDPELDGLPAPAGGTVASVDGVRVVALGPLGLGVTLLPGLPFSDGSRSRYQQVDQAFTALDDGSIEGWASIGDTALTGLTIHRDGGVQLHDAPDGTVASIGTARFGLSATAAGDLFETTDGGRSWRGAGKVPVAQRDFTGGCSPLGCVIGSLARVGWGEASGVVRWSPPPPPAPPPETLPTSRVPRLVCRPAGVPEPAPPVPPPSGDRRSFGTGYGDTFFVERLASASPGGAAAADPRVAPADPRVDASDPVETSVVDTHALSYWPPFEARPSRRVLRGVLDDIALASNAAVPLLTTEGGVGLLVTGGKREHWVTAEGIETVPVFEAERYDWRNSEWPNTGIMLQGQRVLAIGSIRQRSTIEEHGPGTQRMPLFFGLDASAMPKRPLALGRKADGAIGLLTVGGPSPEPAGVAPLLEGFALGPLGPLASWGAARGAADGVCQSSSDGYRALLVVEPVSWFELEAPEGLHLGYRGLVQVRWSESLACVEAIHLAAIDERGGIAREVKIVARFGDREGGGGGLRGDDLWQPLRCSFSPPDAEGL